MLAECSQRSSWPAPSAPHEAHAIFSARHFSGWYTWSGIGAGVVIEQMKTEKKTVEESVAKVRWGGQFSKPARGAPWRRRMAKVRGGDSETRGAVAARWRLRRSSACRRALGDDGRSLSETQFAIPSGVAVRIADAEAGLLSLPSGEPTNKCCALQRSGMSVDKRVRQPVDGLRVLLVALLIRTT